VENPDQILSGGDTRLRGEAAHMTSRSYHACTSPVGVARPVAIEGAVMIPPSGAEVQSKRHTLARSSLNAELIPGPGGRRDV